ncbi:ABC transporter permease subunit, partial [Streptomyces sp. NPDC060131]|uniref:ABC transporter permease subunit n=1 Tax=Streptomyces sp. NPDC060131 TaxID=3347058 RepID=UPI0036607749
GRGGMAMLGEWELPTLKKSGMELGAAPFPQVFEKPAVYTDSHSFVLPHQDSPDPARRREAHRYVAQILKQSLTWASAGHIPAYQPVLAEPEYAALDGAGAWRRLWSITLPQLRRTTGLVAMLQVLASLKVFDQIYILTKGGPNGSTRPVLEYVYDVGFTGYRLGYASAVSYLFFALIVLVSLVQLRLFRRED